MDQVTAMEALRERYAHGGVPMEEFRRLMGTLMVTTDPAECAAIVAQLPSAPAHDLDFPAFPAARRVGSARVEHGHRIVALFGEVDRSGSLWELGPETQVNATFGEVRLDVRMARLTEGENVLRLNALFGEIVVTVPAGLRMLIHSTARFGEVAVPGHNVGGLAMNDSFTFGESDSSSYLRIEASATFGEVRIQTR